MSPHGFEHVLLTCLVAGAALAGAGLVALVVVHMLVRLTGAF